MIVTRAPLRISFIGGGTDYGDFAKTHGGIVLAGSIRKFVYVNLLNLPKYANESFRFTYRKTESVQDIRDFEHPSLRESLIALEWKTPISVATMSDVPGNTGLGSSSAFVVALRLALQEFRESQIDKLELAKFAVFVEREKLGEVGGFQDQYEAAFGGFRSYHFLKNSVQIGNPLIQDDIMAELSSYFTLIPTGPRASSSAAALETSKASLDLLFEMKDRASEVVDELSRKESAYEIAMTLCKAIEIDWNIKQRFLVNGVSGEVYNVIRKVSRLGALSWKLCGAGTSGFVLVSHSPEDAIPIRESFKEGFTEVVEFNSGGAEVLRRKR